MKHLINKAGVRKYLHEYETLHTKKKYKLRISKPALDELNQKLQEMLDYSIQQATEEERSTVLERDVAGF
jgi:hypothetical protein